MKYPTGRGVDGAVDGIDEDMIGLLRKRPSSVNCVCGDSFEASAWRLAALNTLRLRDSNSFPGIESNFSKILFDVLIIRKLNILIYFMEIITCIFSRL